jgi:hypothetical protein
MTADNALTGRTRCIVVALKPATSLALAYVEGAPVACTFAGVAGPVAYDAAIMPRALRTLNSFRKPEKFSGDDTPALHELMKIIGARLYGGSSRRFRDRHTRSKSERRNADQ